MARTIKNNCDYFSHDNNMRNHRKIKALRCKFKEQGYACWCMLLEYLTGCEGNAFEYDEMELELLSGDFDIPADRMKEIIDYCIYPLKLLKKDGTALSSEGLNSRLAPVYIKRDKVRGTFKPKKSTPKQEIFVTLAKPVDLKNFSSAIIPGIPQDQWNTMTPKDQKRFTNEVWKNIFEQETWLSDTCRLKGINKDALLVELKKFMDNRILDGTVNKGLNELKRHFINLLNKKTDG